MTKSMFGNSITPDADRLRPFRAYVSWLCHSIGLHPILMYDTPSGLTLHIPVRALYLNDVCCPPDRERTTITSPERARYNSEAVSPLAKWESYTSEVVSPLAIRTKA